MTQLSPTVLSWTTVFVFLANATLAQDDQSGSITIRNEKHVVAVASKDIKNAGGLYAVRRVSTNINGTAKVLVKGLNEESAERIRRKLAAASRGSDPFYYDIKELTDDEVSAEYDLDSIKRPTIKFTPIESADPGAPKFSKSDAQNKPVNQKSTKSDENSSVENKTLEFEISNKKFSIDFKVGGQLVVNGKASQGTWEQYGGRIKFQFDEWIFRANVKGNEGKGIRYDISRQAADLKTWKGTLSKTVEMPKYREYTLADFAGTYKVTDEARGNIEVYTISANGSVKFKRYDSELGWRPEVSQDFVNLESQLNGFRWVLTTKLPNGIPRRFLITNYLNSPPKLEADNGRLLKTFK